MAAKSPADYIPGQQEAPVQLTSLRDMLNWAQNYARSRSIWPLGYGLACCAIEMIAAGQAHYDLSRFGSEVFRASPRQADLMIVAGTVSIKMGPRLIRLYEQMPDPKWVIALGAVTTYTVVDETLPLQIAALTAIAVLVTLVCVCCWTFFGALMRQFLHTEKRRRWFNYTMAGLLVLSIVPVLFD